MKLFLDCEWNGEGGELISLALVPIKTYRPPFYGALPLPVQMWAVMWKGWIAEVYLTEPEARNELLQWADRPNKAAATAEGALEWIVFAHEES